MSAQDRLRMADVSLKPPAASIPTNLSSRASCCRGSTRVRPEGSERRRGCLPSLSNARLLQSSLPPSGLVPRQDEGHRSATCSGF